MSSAIARMSETTDDRPTDLPTPSSSDLSGARWRVIPLTRLRVGEAALVHEDGLEAAAADTEGGAAMLRAMGLTPEAKIRLCRLGEPCIVAVRCACGGQTRIGLARRVASRIMVKVVG